MRLGSFWGITAPMLVIATKQNGMESILPMLNAVSTNKEIITDLKAELIYLLRAVDKIPKKYFPPDNFPTVENFDKSIRYANGKLYAEGVDEQDFYMSLATGCVIYLLKKHNKSGTDFNLEIKPVSGIEDPVCINNRLVVINKIKEIIKDEDFYLSNLTKIYRKVSKELMTGTGGCDYKALAKSFLLNEKVPENLIVNGNSVSFSQEELKVIEFFVSSKETILELLSHLKVKEITENRVFGKTFRELMMRKPTSLYWATQERFDIIKSKNNESFLTSLLKEMRIDLKQFENSLKTEVISKKQYKSGNLSLSNKIYLERINSFSQEKKQFFLGLNKIFNLNYTRSEWEKFIKSLNQIGICGINLFSMNLFKDSIGNMTFISNYYIVKTDEEILEFKNVLDNIKDLVSTIKPIGTILED